MRDCECDRGPVSVVWSQDVPGAATSGEMRKKLRGKENNKQQQGGRLKASHSSHMDQLEDANQKLML